MWVAGIKNKRGRYLTRFVGSLLARRQLCHLEVGTTSLRQRRWPMKKSPVSSPSTRLSTWLMRGISRARRHSFSVSRPGTQAARWCARCAYVFYLHRATRNRSLFSEERTWGLPLYQALSMFSVFIPPLDIKSDTSEPLSLSAIFLLLSLLL